MKTVIPVLVSMPGTEGDLTNACLVAKILLTFLLLGKFSLLTKASMFITNFPGCTESSETQVSSAFIVIIFVYQSATGF